MTREGDDVVTVKGSQPQILHNIEQDFVILRRRQCRFVWPRGSVLQSIAVMQFDNIDHPPSAAPTLSMKRSFNCKPPRLSRKISVASRRARSRRRPRRSTNTTSIGRAPSKSSAWNVTPSRWVRLAATRPTPSPACRELGQMPHSCLCTYAAAGTSRTAASTCSTRFWVMMPVAAEPATSLAL